MRRASLESLHRVFDRFLTTYIIEKNSFLNDETSILSDTNLKEVSVCFVANYDESDTNFETKVSGQFANARPEVKLNFAHAEWLWCFSVGDIKRWTKQQYIKNRLGLEAKDQKDVFPETFGHAGQWHTNNKYWEIVFCISVIEILDQFSNQAERTVDDLKKAIVEFCLYLKYDTDLELLKEYQDIIDGLKVRRYAMSNILLYLANPEHFERIASDNHKQRIVSSFRSLEEEADKAKTIDERIYAIRKSINTLISNPDFDFYEEPAIKKVWNTADDDLEFDELQALLFKKAVVFYGPPGTSKTYKAKELATAYILNQYIKDKNRLTEYLGNPQDVVQNRIHPLQLHANYTYENFVGGYLLKDGNTEFTPGRLIAICDAAKADLNARNPNLDIPHVLILDEMNRVDLSKLFGEVFSALEQRDYDISAGVADLKINIPRNLHIIGTMNEIDFSVEQLDFALRRRFLWFYYGYKPERLRLIIEEKSGASNSRILSDAIDRFYTNVNALNNHINQIEELGKMYQVGHTFFGDIVSIYNQYRAMKGYTRKNNFLFENNGPAEILWNISVLPIIDAFLGNQEESTKSQYLKELRELFLK